MKVGIIGLGYMGLPLAIAFADQGHEVAGLDNDLVDLDDGLGSCDLACVATAHPDYERVVAEAPLVLDFRGVIRGIEAGNLVRL